MPGVEPRPAHATPGLRHEALLYAGEDEFAAAVSGFVSEAVAADEPVLVVVAPRRIDRLRRELGASSARVEFADMTDVGANPARLLPVWQDFADRQPPGAPLRGVGEPVWRGRSEAELAECALHESLLNVALAGATDLRVLCPYDVAELDPATIATAAHTHPILARDGHHQASPAYTGPQGAFELFARPLPEPDADVAELRFVRGPLHGLRRFVADGAARAGLVGGRLDDLVLAANEIAGNSIVHGGGSGLARTWQHDGSFVCEVWDAGHVRDPLVGRTRPRRDAVDGRGVWMANELCDLVQMRSLDTGTVVRLHMRVQPGL